MLRAPVVDVCAPDLDSLESVSNRYRTACCDSTCNERPEDIVSRLVYRIPSATYTPMLLTCWPLLLQLFTLSDSVLSELKALFHSTRC